MNKDYILKPCPFCGGEAWVIQILENLYAVECRKCWTRTGTYQPTKAEAIEAWNRRAEPERHRGEWLEDGHERGFSECSKCGYIAVSVLSERHYNFCPNCGAKMTRGE